MKKRSTRKPVAKSTTVADECKAYRSQFSEYVCEIEPLMNRDREMCERLRRCLIGSSMNRITQVHHIFGRSRHEESNWFTNLVLTFAGSHQSCGHDYSPYALEVCALMAKIDRQTRHEELQLIGLEPSNTPPDRLHWNVKALNKICGSPTLAGRIEGILIPGLSRFPVFQQMAEQVLAKIHSV